MPKIPLLNPLLQAWLLEGPLSAQVPDYVERLRRGRYATHTSSRCLNGVAHFAHLGGMLGGYLMIRYWRGQPPFGRR